MDKKISELITKLRFPITLVIIIWAVEIYETFSNIRLSRLGIFPREWDGLIGIITSPFIHSDYEHLLSNTVPLFVLTSITIFFYKRVAVPAFVLIQLLTGFAVWVFARPSFHIGASGVVYGLVAFVFWSGVFRRNIKSVVLALVVVIAYSGYFHGIVPNKEGVSWESHLFGGFMGILVAFIFKDLKEVDEVKRDPWADEGDDKVYFFERDVFDMTKQERKLELEERMKNEENEGWTQDLS